MIENNNESIGLQGFHMTMDDVLSPAEAQRLLEEGFVAPVDVFKRLKVEDCTFAPEIDARGESPLVRTGFSSFGSPASGRLAFTPKDIRENESNGRSSVLVVGFDALYKFQRDRGYLYNVKNVILVCPNNQYSDRNHLEHYSHARGIISSYCSALLDHPLRPQISFKAGKDFITFSKGGSLSAGEEVTIDPVRGNLWRGVHVKETCAYDSGLFQKTVDALGFMKTATEVAFHVPRNREDMRVWEIGQKWQTRQKIGLLRSDMDFLEHLQDIKSCPEYPTLLPLVEGAVPCSFQLWYGAGVHRKEESHYRLLDVTGLIPFFPESLRNDFPEQDSHIPGTKFFALRSTLYTQQIHMGYRLFRIEKNIINLHRPAPQTIIVPSVKSVEEVRYFKELIKRMTPQHADPLIRFGVMMETKEALKHTEGIAPLCDSLCYGTNDLTKEITGLAREEMDHSGWMKECGYEGVSPYDVLVPEVIEPVAQSIAAARKANPNIFINMCGDQTGGHHIPSIEAVLDMGVNQITVPPRLDLGLRAKLAIARHYARKLGL